VPGEKGDQTVESRLQTVLVTGGAGFIGSALSRRMAHQFGRWVAFDSLHPQVHASSARPVDLSDAAELVVGDVIEPTDWDNLFSSVRPDVIIHLAAETGTSQSLNEASRHARVNVVGTTEMTDALVRHEIVPSLIVLASSRAVYGEGTWHSPEQGDFSPGQRPHAQFEAAQWDFPNAEPLPSDARRTIAHPVNVYGATKLAQELLLEAWCGSHGVNRSILRLQNVYGPGQSLINAYTGIVSLFSQWAEEGRVIPVYEDGGIVRDFVFIDDVVAAFEAAVTAGDKVGPYDIGSGMPTSLLEVAKEIARYHGAPEPEITGAYRDGDVRFAACSIDRAVQELGWAPDWDVSRGLAALQEWMAGQQLRVSST
jgi:dTDP-L-rhamnose 4-epimerase